MTDAIKKTILLDLANKMRTNNWIGFLPGTNVTNFKNGINDFLNPKGYKLNTKDGLLTYYNGFKRHIDAGKPSVMAMFAYDFYDDVGNLYSRSSSGTYNIKGRRSDTLHFVVGYGYLELEYWYKSGTTTKTAIEKFMKVATGGGVTSYIRESTLSYYQTFQCDIVKK